LSFEDGAFQNFRDDTTLQCYLKILFWQGGFGHNLATLFFREIENVFYLLLFVRPTSEILASIPRLSSYHMLNGSRREVTEDVPDGLAGNNDNFWIGFENSLR
jgi:hypothetical protein